MNVKDKLNSMIEKAQNSEYYRRHGVYDMSQQYDHEIDELVIEILDEFEQLEDIIQDWVMKSGTNE